MIWTDNPTDGERRKGNREAGETGQERERRRRRRRRRKDKEKRGMMLVGYIALQYLPYTQNTTKNKGNTQQHKSRKDTYELRTHVAHLAPPYALSTVRAR